MSEYILGLLISEVKCFCIANVKFVTRNIYSRRQGMVNRRQEAADIATLAERGPTEFLTSCLLQRGEGTVRADIAAEVPRLGNIINEICLIRIENNPQPRPVVRVDLSILEIECFLQI